MQGHVLDYSDDLLVVLLLDREAGEPIPVLKEVVQETMDKIEITFSFRPMPVLVRSNLPSMN